MFCYVLLTCNVFCKAHSLSLDSIQCYISEVCLRTPIELNLVDLFTAFTANINCSACKIPLGNKVIWEISYEIYISWCFDPIQLNMNSWLILFFRERVFNLYLWTAFIIQLSVRVILYSRSKRTKFLSSIQFYMYVLKSVYTIFIFWFGFPQQSNQFSRVTCVNCELLFPFTCGL